MKNLTGNLQYLMQSSGVTSFDLASVLSVSPELIAKLKNGDLDNPSFNIVVDISKYFNISLENLIFSKLN